MFPVVNIGHCLHAKVATSHIDGDADAAVNTGGGDADTDATTTNEAGDRVEEVSAGMSEEMGRGKPHQSGVITDEEDVALHSS
jgi:hypothetical protein